MREPGVEGAIVARKNSDRAAECTALKGVNGVSHYCEVQIEMQGSEEVLVLALCGMEFRNGLKLKASDILRFKERVALFGFVGDVREQKAHIVIPGAGRPGCKNLVGGLSNDLGFERKSNGKWSFYVSENEAHYYDAAWQKRLLSKWAQATAEVDAESKHRSYVTTEDDRYVYVRVQVS